MPRVEISIIGGSHYFGVEMQGTLLDQGVTLMVAGMGTVFVFLTVLVIAMTVMSSTLRRLQPVSSDVSDEEIAAISAAIQRHRQK